MSKVPQAKRELCIRRIKEIYDASLTAESSASDKLLFLARYPGVAKIVEDFEYAHLKLIQDSAVDFEKENQIRSKFDKMHYAIKAMYYMLTDTQSIAPVSQTSNPSSKIKLLKISLPQFSGDLALWPSFIALYDTSIHTNQQISAMEKYQYLLASLTGEALNVVKNLPLSADHLIAYDMLRKRYQNKRKLATHYWHSLVNAKPLKMDSANSLRTLLDIFNENTRALQHREHLQLMQFSTESWGFILLNILLDKLTPSLREKFESEYRQTEIPQYSQLIKFLHEYCKVFASMPGSSTTLVKSGDKGARYQNQALKSNASVSSFVTSMTTCLVCNEQHLITKCPRFLKLSAKERHSTAKELKLCLNCLRLGHGVKTCPYLDVSIVSIEAPYTFAF
ncbi:unnamed protein product [Lasius platythorax]|uniref:Uncharacterized protein n=1 Tax=Lasius platythorax TaxID=488582 RepID=A0AAV2MXZ6_9HYME